MYKNLNAIEILLNNSSSTKEKQCNIKFNKGYSFLVKRQLSNFRLLRCFLFQIENTHIRKLNKNLNFVMLIFNVKQRLENIQNENKFKIIIFRNTFKLYYSNNIFTDVENALAYN